MSYKPLNGNTYFSIPHFSDSKRIDTTDKRISSGQESICVKKLRDNNDIVIVNEKVDGTCVSVAKINGEILPLMRAGYLANTSYYQQHHIFASWVYENHIRFEELLSDNERICGEWMIQVHGTRYNIPHEPFVVFDIFKYNDRISYLEQRDRIVKYDFIPANLISYGMPIDTDTVMKRLRVSGHGAEQVEGAVWRVERFGKFDFMGKYVIPEKEDGKYLTKEFQIVYYNMWKSDSEILNHC